MSAWRSSRPPSCGNWAPCASRPAPVCKEKAITTHPARSESLTTHGSDGRAPAAEPDDPDAGPFDIYETARGPCHVGNQVRRLILKKMQGSELTVPEMIDVTGLTKSTISTHLAVLHREQMVSYREDPSDRRKKRYFLTARHVGTTRPCTERLPFHGPGFEHTPGAGPGVDRLLLRSLLAELACCGLDLAPIVHETGRRVGELLGKGSPCGSLRACAEAANGIWEEAGWGRLEVLSEDPPVLGIDGCGLCFDGADERMSLCEVAAGVVEGMVAEALQVAVEVRPRPSRPGPDGCACTFELSITPSVDPGPWVGPGTGPPADAPSSS